MYTYVYIYMYIHEHVHEYISIYSCIHIFIYISCGYSRNSFSKDPSVERPYYSDKGWSHN